LVVKNRAAIKNGINLSKRGFAGVYIGMRNLACVVIVLVTSAAICQPIKPSERHVDHFQVEGASRLAALAKLGALTNTTLLIEAGSLDFLQAPITMAINHTTVALVVGDILHGLDSYKIRDEGALLILSTPGPLNRTLNLPLGIFSFTGKSISSLHPFLAFLIRRATGCNPQGYGWAGPAMDLDMPPIQLAQATLEKVVAKVADASEASMWVIGPEPSSEGCIDNPGSRWQVGLYGFGRVFSGCETPFRESVGPPLVIDLVPGQHAKDECFGVKLPNPVPDLSPTHSMKR
jgi:hypothetical protein